MKIKTVSLIILCLAVWACASAGGADVQHQMYMVTFDSDGTVKDYLSTYGASESDRGLSTRSSFFPAGHQSFRVRHFWFKMVTREITV
jgi:hypothetical protein